MSKKRFDYRSDQKKIRAEHKKEFFRKLKYLCEAAGTPEVFPMIPSKMLESIYLTRILPLKIIPAKGENIPKQVLNSMREMIYYMMKDQRYPIIKDGPIVSLYDLHYVFFGFLVYLEAKSSSIDSHLKEALNSLGKLQDRQIEILNNFQNMLFVSCILHSTYDKNFYWISTSTQVKDTGTWGMEETLTIHSFEFPRKHIYFDGASRPVIRLCMPLLEGEVKYASMKPEDLGIVDPRPGKVYDVYMQSHVLQRLSERLDCIGIHIVHFQIFFSLVNPKVVIKSDGTILIEYRIGKTKLGYFKASLHQDMLILRTFLFITNDGTPEADKLEEVCGLKRLDKTFLSLDKLGSFMNKELNSNAELHSLFQQAGCEHLLDGYSDLKKYMTNDAKPLSLQAMLKYLGISSGKDFIASLVDEKEQNEEVSKYA